MNLNYSLYRAGLPSLITSCYKQLIDSFKNLLTCMKRDFMFNALYISYNFQKALKHLIYKKIWHEETNIASSTGNTL